MTRESEIRKAQGRTNEVRSGLQTAATFGGAAIAPKVASKILPFLNQYIPADLALKGINKVMPSLGNFLKNGVKQGLSLQSGLDFIKDNFSNKQSQESVKQDKNIIEQYSPELHQFMTENIGAGEDPIRAAAQAIFDKKKNFEPIIRKMEKEHKTPWTAIVESIYGGKGVKNAQNTRETERQDALKQFNQRKKGLVEQETERFQNEYGNQSGQGLDPRVAQILQQGNEILNRARGQ